MYWDLRRCVFRLLRVRNRILVRLRSLLSHDVLQLRAVYDVWCHVVSLHVWREAMQGGSAVSVNDAVMDVVVLVDVVLPPSAMGGCTIDC